LHAFDDGSGPALYVGGLLTVAGGVVVNRIARWNGASWSSLGSGTADGAVFALCAFDDGTGSALYAGGDFNSAGGVVGHHIARWRSTSAGSSSRPATSARTTSPAGMARAGRRSAAVSMVR